MLNLCLAREHTKNKLKCLCWVKTFHVSNELPIVNQLMIDDVIEQADE